MKGLLLIIFFMIKLFMDKAFCRECFLDIGVMIDRSTSISKSHWKEMLAFVRAFAREVDYDLNRARVGVITAGHPATVNIKLNSHQSRSSFERHLATIPHSGPGTNRLGALRKLRTVLFNETNGDRVEMPNIGLFIIHGPPDRDKNKTINEAKLLKQFGVKIFVIGVGHKYDHAEAKAIASKPVFDYVYSTKFGHLKNLVKRVAHPICQMGKEKLLYFCSFEEIDTQCNMLHDIYSEYAWIRKKGPSDQYKLAPTSGVNSKYYMHAESRIYIPGDKATMFVPFRITGAKYCIKFSYNISANKVGTLQLLTMKKYKVVRVMWSRDRSTDKKWRHHKVTFHLKSGQQIAFRAKRLSNSPVGPALDRIQILLGACTK